MLLLTNLKNEYIRFSGMSQHIQVYLVLSNIISLKDLLIKANY